MINYLCTSPLPKVDGTDAVYNELATLNQQFKGNIESLYPFKTPSSRYPVMMLGAHNIRKIKAVESHSKINHIYGSGLFNMPAMRTLNKPTVYSLIAGIASPNDLPSKKYLSRFDAIVVSNERDYDILCGLGLSNIHLIRTSISVEDFDKHKLPLNKTLKLMMASAPWETKQFKSKGIHIILAALQQLENVEFTFLWRDILGDEMGRLIKLYNVEDKVTLIDKRVDVNTYLKANHGTVLLANDSRVIKAYPHSLLESLCSGKPVMLTSDIPLSDFVAKKQCGIVIDKFTTDCVIESIKQFKKQYDTLSTKAYELPQEAFSKDRFIVEHENLYKTILSKVAG